MRSPTHREKGCRKKARIYANPLCLPTPSRNHWLEWHACKTRVPRKVLSFGTFSGKSKGGLSKGGLGPKGANWAKKGPFGAISALPPWLWGAEELVPIGPEKAPIGPEKVPICPEKARFRRKEFPPIFSENLGLKPNCEPPFRFSQHDLFQPQVRPSFLGADALSRSWKVSVLSRFWVGLRWLLSCLTKPDQTVTKKNYTCSCKKIAIHDKIRCFRNDSVNILARVVIFRYFRKPLRGPRPTESQNPLALKKEIPKNPKTPMSPKVNARSPKVNARYV